MTGTGRSAGRAGLAVVAGAVVWATLWLTGTRIVTSVGGLDPNAPLTVPGILVGYILYSVVLSLLAGWVAALVRGESPMTAVWVLAGIQLAMGIAAEASYWALTPVWYHVVFLALIVPATVYGGMLRARRAGVGNGSGDPRMAAGIRR